MLFEWQAYIEGWSLTQCTLNPDMPTMTCDHFSGQEKTDSQAADGWIERVGAIEARKDMW